MFEWDPKKAKSNFLKHGITFEQASTVFFDPNALDGLDIEHSKHEPRYLRLGWSLDRNTLTVAYTVRKVTDGTTKIRIISARKASKKERKTYAE